MKLKGRICVGFKQKNIGDEVVLSGWAQRRGPGGLIFVDLRYNRYCNRIFDNDISQVAFENAEHRSNM